MGVTVVTEFSKSFPPGVLLQPHLGVDQARLIFCVQRNALHDHLVFGLQLMQPGQHGIEGLALQHHAHRPIGLWLHSAESQVMCLRSAGYGYSVRKNIGFTYLPLERDTEETQLEVELFGETVTAKIAPDVLYDPAGAALK